jgi:hypothetical protein
MTLLRRRNRNIFRELKMKDIKNPLIIVFAIVGACAVIYGGWHMYRQHVADAQSKAAFTAPPASGVPDMYHNAPPPPQP